MNLTGGKREINDFRVCSVNPYDVMATNWLSSSIVVAVAFDYDYLFLVFDKTYTCVRIIRISSFVSKTINFILNGEN